MRQTFQIDSNGFSLTLFAGDLISETIRSRGSWESHVTDILRALLKPGDTVLDAGANFGFHTLEMASRVGESGRVIALEPQRVVFQQLCHHVFVNRFHNTWCLPLALGDKNREVAIAALSEVSSGNIGATPIGVGAERVSMTSLDSFNIPNLALMKLDVQGSELLALKGGEQTIQRHRPTIVIEVEESWLNLFKTSSKEVLEWLFARGYIVYRIENEWPTDCVAVPVEREQDMVAALQKLAFPTSRIEGPTVDLTFDGKPFWSTCRSYRVA